MTMAAIASGTLESEQRLEDIHTQGYAHLMGIPLADARAAVQEMIRQAKDAARREGADELPEPYGDHLLEQEDRDPELQARLAGRRGEGVTDDDVRVWWNLPDVERRLIVEIDAMWRLGVFAEAVRRGKTPQEALDFVRKHFPMFGSPQEAPDRGDDRPLPIELKPRVNAWTERQRDALDGLRARIAAASSFNAVVRDELRAGRM